MTVCPTLVLAGNWADQMVHYTAGTNPVAGYSDPNTALGEPSRMTGYDPFVGAVTPFNPAWRTDQVVSLGAGGSLTVSFDQPITNDPNHPFGVDLLVFGNAGYDDPSYPQGIASGLLLGAGHGLVEVSADGSDWHTVPGVEADREYPTQGYTDLTDPYATSPGAALSDFTRPVNPTFHISPGMTYAQVVAAYAGSGGGVGVDIGAAGLASISFVRISNPNASGTVEVDAFSRVAAVPTPGTLALFLGVSMSISRRRRARDNCRCAP